MSSIGVYKNIVVDIKSTQELDSPRVKQEFVQQINRNMPANRNIIGSCV